MAGNYTPRTYTVAMKVYVDLTKTCWPAETPAKLTRIITHKYIGRLETERASLSAGAALWTPFALRGAYKRYKLFFVLTCPLYENSVSGGDLTLYPVRRTAFFSHQQIKTRYLCTIYQLKATDQLIKDLTSTAIKELAILREVALKCENGKLSNIIDRPLNYSIFQQHSVHSLIRNKYWIPCASQKEIGDLMGW